MRFHAAIIIMRMLERRVTYGEAPSARITAISHTDVSTKRTPKLKVKSATADDRRSDFLIPTSS